MSGTVYNSSQELGTLMTEVQQNLLFFCMVGWLLGLLVDWIFSILILSVKVNAGVLVLALAGVLVLAVALAGVRPRSLDQPSPLGRIPRAEEDGGRGGFNLSCFFSQHCKTVTLQSTPLQLLDSTIYQVVRIACDLFNGSSDSCGYHDRHFKSLVLQQQDQAMP